MKIERRPKKYGKCWKIANWFSNIKSQTTADKLPVCLNLRETKEIAFRLPRIKYFHLLPAVGDIEQLPTGL